MQQLGATSTISAGALLLVVATLEGGLGCSYAQLQQTQVTQDPPLASVSLR
jgi:hypothetical protein